MDINQARKHREYTELEDYLNVLHEHMHDPLDILVEINNRMFFFSNLNKKSKSEYLQVISQFLNDKIMNQSEIKKSIGYRFLKLYKKDMPEKLYKDFEKWWFSYKI